MTKAKQPDTSIKKLTKAFVEGFPYLEDEKETQIIIRDSQIQGFGIRVTKKYKTYFVERKLSGKTKRIGIGRHGDITIDQARKQAVIIVGELAQGNDFALDRKIDDIQKSKQLKKSKVEGITLKQIYIHSMESANNLKPATIKKYDRSILVNLKCWANTPIVSITQSMVEAKYKDLLKNSVSEANHTMRVLRAVFNYAMVTIELSENVYLINRNPVDRLTKLKLWKKVPARTNHLKFHQIKDWWLAIEQETPILKIYLRLVLLTGVRRENAASLRWEQVDFEDKSFSILGKGKDAPLSLPISSYLLSMLAEMKQQSTSVFVFPSHGKSGHVKEFFKVCGRIEDSTGIKASIHDLRRTYAKICAQLGLPMHAVKCLMLHSLKSDVTSEHYQQHELEALRKPAQKIEDFILSQVNKSNNVVPIHNNIETG